MSLRSRLVVAVAAISLVALVAADLATYSAFRSFLYDRVDQSLQQTAASLRPGLQHAGLLGGVPAAGGGGVPGGSPPGAAAGGAGQPADVVQTQAPGYSVEVRGPAGTTSFPSYQQGGVAYSPELPSHLAGFSAATATSPPQALSTVPSARAGGPEFRVLAVREPGGYTLVLGLPLATTAAALHRLLAIELVVTGAALAAAVLLSLWLVRLGLRPLADVEDTAERIAAGELGQRVPGEGARTEVGRLARTVNVMLGRIERAFAERDATEAALRRSEERLRRFVADASHELRTPLAAVSAYAELFDRGARERPADLDRAMAGIRDEAARMGHLVEDLFLLARLDEGRPLERQPVDLVATAAGAVETGATVGPGWPVRLVAAGPVDVVGDGARLRQVLDNLLANVRAHTPEGTPVEVRAGTGADGWAELAVADRGPGLGEGEAARIFERFYRADPARGRGRGGTGLGLSIVAAIVAAHGGTVGAADRPGGGTVVTVRLPPAPADGGGSDPVAVAAGGPDQPGAAGGAPGGGDPASGGVSAPTTRLAQR